MSAANTKSFIVCSKHGSSFTKDGRKIQVKLIDYKLLGWIMYRVLSAWIIYRILLAMAYLTYADNMDHPTYAPSMAQLSCTASVDKYIVFTCMAYLLSVLA